MNPERIDAAQAAAALDGFDAIIDARSESEFALDHLPGAVNWPSLTDAQRHIIGTEYKQVSAFEARKRGATMVARNIAGHLEREGAPLARTWRPLVYCWRGGQRSGALALVLAQVGFVVQILEGGYREFRRFVVADLDRLAPTLDLRVLCGKTGSGKSRLLQVLHGAGAQVLDLEALAHHRGSVLGLVPGQAQPSQKHFETSLWNALRRFDALLPVYVESESRTIGRLRVPEPLLARMRAAPCLRIEMPLAARIELLIEDYAHHVTDIEGLCERLQALREARGAELVGRWQAAARAGRIEEVVRDLLAEHYDPIYSRSMQRNFAQFETAPVLPADDGSAPALARLSSALLALSPTNEG